MGRVKPLRILALTGVEPAGRPDNTDSIRCRDMAAQALTSLGHTVVSMDIAPEDMEDLPSLKEKILGQRCHVALNFFEGFSTSPEQEVRFASLLEETMPFTGNGAETLRICLDKDTVRERLMDSSVAVPYGFSVKDPSDPRLKGISFPLFLKPTSEDGSVGIDELSLVSDKDELKKSLIGMLQGFPGGITVESFIDGPEYSVGLLGGPSLQSPSGVLHRLRPISRTTPLFGVRFQVGSGKPLLFHLPHYRGGCTGERGQDS